MYSSTVPDASNFVSSYNIAFYSIVGISLVLLAGLTVLMLYFIYRYNRKKNAEAVQIEGNTKLEVIWTGIPVLLVLGMFYFGWSGWNPMTKPPKDAANVTSIARMWSFSFKYENGKESKDLILQVNTPVKITLVSLDVIHSLFIPAFKVKSDMIPGNDKMMWFLPQREGEYDLYCAEYCGLQHSYMQANVRVLSKEEYNKWYVDTAAVVLVAEDAAPGAAGLAIINAQGCYACHSTDGSKIIGPTFRNLFGEKQVIVKDGNDVTITVDEEYIKKAIYDPNSEIVKGYPRDLMQSYKESLSEDDILKIIEYLKSINEK
jgi:cytochrome c oxidase subunit II